jgi:hypothetical protein
MRLPAVALSLLIILGIMQGLSSPAMAANLPAIVVTPDPTTDSRYTIKLNPNSYPSGVVPTLYNLQFSSDGGHAPTQFHQTIDADPLTGTGQFSWGKQESRAIQSYSCAGVQGGCPSDLVLFIRINFLGNGTVAAYESGWSAWTSLPTFPDITPNPGPSPSPLPNPPPSQKPTPPSSACGAVRFVGVRGSGETKNDAGGYGKAVASVKTEIEKIIPGVKSGYIQYRALAVRYADPNYYGGGYTLSVGDGIQALQRYLRDFFAQCPHTKLILAGYSQGAQVAGDVYEVLTKTQKQRIIGVILLGDPRFNPKQSAANAATGYDRKLRGIYQFSDSRMRKIPAASVQQVRSYCIPGDPVCNFSIKNAVPCITGRHCAHLEYAQAGWTRKAAAWVTSR